MESTPSWLYHMRLYYQVDIALDTSPFNGCTTSFETLMMGTPIVTLKGDWFGGRMTASVLTALGRPEWIASSAADYTRIVVELASDTVRLRNSKRTLQAEVLDSPLCDGALLSRALEDAFRRMIADHNVSLSNNA